MNKKTKPPTFQVLLIDNNANDDVRVQEAEYVDFYNVKQHLKNGGSVFITSKNTQKISYTKSKAQLNYTRSRKTLGFLFRQQMRSP
jgi:hypothetical protein